MNTTEQYEAPIVKTIAIVDDDQDVLYLVQSFLKKEGYRPLVYQNGVEFLKAIETKSISPDVIVMDVEMPFKTGIEVIYECTTKFGLKDTPVIFLSGRADAPTLSAAYENNAIFLHYIVKPVNLPLLLMNIQKMLILRDQHVAISEANAGLAKLTKQLKSENATIQKDMDASLAAVTQLRMYIQELTWSMSTHG